MKKLLAYLFSPLSFCIGLMALGLLLLYFSPPKKIGKIFITIGLLVLIISSYESLSGRILRTLESQHPPLTISQIMAYQAERVPSLPIRWIVVLAGGFTGDANLPYQLQISLHSRIRLLEGIRLHHLIPGSKIILTGGNGFHGPPESTNLSRFAEELGVSRSNIVLEVESRDTKDHPIFVRDLIHDEPFILVTSAFHMPRAMKLFAKQGLFPLPAPAGHWTPPSQFWSAENFFPSAAGLRLAELAYHEYMGLMWAWMRGQI